MLWFSLCGDFITVLLLTDILYTVLIETWPEWALTNKNILLFLRDLNTGGKLFFKTTAEKNSMVVWVLKFYKVKSLIRLSCY